MAYRLWPAQLTASAVIGTLAWNARLPVHDEEELSALAQRFTFARVALPDTGAPRDIEVHPTNPSVTHIAKWLSSIGTAISLGDIDEDGVSNDLCFVEPRSGEVVVAPAPDTPASDGGARFETFALQTSPAWDRHAMVATGCKIGDFNEDGLADLMVHFVGRTPLLFLRKAPEAPPAAPPVDPAATAEATQVVTPPAEPALAAPTLAAPTLAAYAVVPLLAEEQRWWTSTVLQVDIDVDGHLDLVVGNYFPDGQEIFGEGARGPVNMHDSFSFARNGGTNRVLLWKGGTSGASPTATYEEIPNPFPGDDATAWTLALGAADLDHDGRSELYVANDFGPDCLYANRSTPGDVKLVRLFGRTGFTIPASLVLGKDSFKGMGVDFGDVNGDGAFDLFVSNITTHGGLEESHFLYLSDGETSVMDEGVAPYADAGERMGVSRSSWAWDTRMVDFDNDGTLELMQATGFLKGDINWWADLAELANAHDAMISDPGNWPNFPANIDISGHDPEPFYVLGAEGTYVDISSKVGFDNSYNSRGLAVADIDRDGDLDLTLANQWEDSWLFRNDQKGAGRALGLHLQLSPGAKTTTVVDGTATARESWPAVGAFARVTAPDGRTWIRQVDGGNGHSGANAAELHFGLGELPADAPLAVHLSWRDRAGKLQETDLTLTPGWHTVTLATDL